MKSIPNALRKKTSLLLLGLSGMVAVVDIANANSFATDWRSVSSSQILYGVMRAAWPMSTAQQAAEMAASRCGPEVERLQREGHLVLSFRGTGTPTTSPYIFAGNCDVQVLRK